ncbi:uncharacterized protein LOC106637631 [Copidosoma floridanum]|uniref:uncharacterized protein LOC106637631 n=1 Tax=Copidosoma floridanum TaxID=29053 RepID=UPI0006C9465A|nr:uncharacterized protein LOC106637631 [Copidosoma floridanum]
MKNQESHHSSSGGYAESPPDRQLWTEEERRRRKKTFSLDFPGGQEPTSYGTTEPDSTGLHETTSTTSPLPRHRSRTKSSAVRSPHRNNHRRRSISDIQPALTPGQQQTQQPAQQGRSPPRDEGVANEEPSHVQTSDDSSCSHHYHLHHHHQHYHGHRRSRESPRRKSSAHVSGRRRSNEDKNAALTGSLPRRRSRQAVEYVCSSSRLSPGGNSSRYGQSGHSPPTAGKSPSPEVRLKAMSAESLRSVSPGSDSVFFSVEEQPVDQAHCHHCGREVPEEIVQPPAGFADSPDAGHKPSSSTKHTPGHRLFKKFDKRYRTEDRGDRRHYRGSMGRSDVRAKSEERDAKSSSRYGEDFSRKRLHARSTDASLEILTACAWTNHWDAFALTDCLHFPRLDLCCNDFLESDKRVIVRREAGGEFGFRIHGSKPLVVSAIEPDTPAENSGLEVGDIVISVNGKNVLEASHSEVVRLAHSGPDVLELEVARTCNVLAPQASNKEACKPEPALHSGYLWRKARSADKWVRCWFALRRDNCLYYYKTDTDAQPLGAVMLLKYDVDLTHETRAHSFAIRKHGAPTLHLAADSAEATTRWCTFIHEAVERNNKTDTWLDGSLKLRQTPACMIQRPDCVGYLCKQHEHMRRDCSPGGWPRRYCVLKDAVLYFYSNANSEQTFGVAYLHGYRVQVSASTAGGRKHAFEIQPPDPTQRVYTFAADSEMDKKRWLAALEYSIDRWIKVD